MRKGACFPKTGKIRNFKLMQTDEEFQIDINGLMMKVTSHLINGDEVFHIIFSDGRPPLIVNEVNSCGRIFWTSIPQGRQKEAEFFGARIAEKLKNK
jgi:hypothetical protein